MEDDDLFLDVWSGDWELPSVDHDCLIVLAFCKFSEIPIKLRKTNNPLFSPTGVLPVLHRNGTKEGTFDNIIKTLSKKQSSGGGDGLPDTLDTQSKPYVCLAEQKLLPAVLYTWWLDEQNYIDVTRPLYASVSRFPLNFYFPSRLQKNAFNRVYVQERMEPRIVSKKDIEAQIFRDAKECLNMLSNLLGDNDFFFGSVPSLLDAYIFGYLAPLMKSPVSSNPLIKHFKACDNIFALCNRVLVRYFPLSPEESEEKRKKEEERKKKMEADALLYPNKKRDIILGVIFATVTMVTYAVMNGMISIESVNSSSATEFDDDDDDD